MPLHLLGKKSWNVYNPESIARVRRDEAQAKSQQAETERIARQDAADERLRRLRGQDDHIPHHDRISGETKLVGASEHRRKRLRLTGENDTDRDLRLAIQKTEKNVEHSVLDKHGHIDLIGSHRSANSGSGHTAAEIEKPGLMLKDAAGRGKSQFSPWYSSQAQSTPPRRATTLHDVWGNEDPRRWEREQQRQDANDPLLAMKKAVKQIHENEKQRKHWRSQREKDLTEVEHMARTYRRRSEDSDAESLEGFSLDSARPPRKSSHHRRKERARDKNSHGHRIHKDRHKHRHRRRSQSPERAPVSRS